jgi:hypothetical protein
MRDPVRDIPLSTAAALERALGLTACQYTTTTQELIFAKGTSSVSIFVYLASYLSKGIVIITGTGVDFT